MNKKTEYVPMRCELRIRQALDAMAQAEFVSRSEALRLAVQEAAERRGLFNDTNCEEENTNER